MKAARVASLLAALPLVTVGMLLLIDRPGLSVEYFALGEPWEGAPVHATVGEPRLEAAAQAPLVTDVVFSARWRGWVRVADGGRHRFRLDADDGAYLRVGSELVADTAGLFGEARPGGRIELEPGFHRIEIGYFQITGEGRMTIDWRGPGNDASEAMALPVGALYAGRPLAARAALRRAFAPWPPAYVPLAGLALVLAAAWLVGRAAAATAARIAERLSAFAGLPFQAVLLAALVATAFFGILPLTGALSGGDDTAYLSAAYFNERRWFFNRYAHIYLLKAFVFVAGGDPILGVRLWWSAVFATTVGALAVAVRSVGPGLQLGTLAATLFVLFSQNTLFGTIGSAFADYSAMAFITVAVAIFLHGLHRAAGRPPPRHEWHALALGAVTCAAFRSKEVGAVLLLLAALLIFVDGRLDARRFARRMAYWLAGAAALLLVLVALDGLILGDILFTFRGERFAMSRGMNFPAGVRPRGDHASWLGAIWHTPGHPAGLALRWLWVGVGAAAVAAGIRRRRLELKLLHLLPLAYLLALMALYVRLPHPVSVRMLIPIVPVACLMTGFLLHHAGLDEIPWRRLVTPTVAAVAVPAIGAIFLIVVPYRAGRLDAADFLPAQGLARYGWGPDLFATGVLLPAVVVVALAAFAFAAHRRRARLVALALVFLSVFALGFDFNRRALAERQSAQRTELLLFPWRVFRAELEADPPRIVALAPQLAWRYHMTAQTRGSIARLALRRGDLYVTLSSEPGADVDVAIGDGDNYRDWRRRVPELSATAKTARPGLLILVRPRAALEGSAAPAGTDRQ